MTCPPNQIQRGVECYEKPPNGYDWTTQSGLLIGKICPSGTNDSGITCWYDRGVGKIPQKKPCDKGQRDDGTSCWSGARIVKALWDRTKCNDDEENKAGLCYKKARSGFNCKVTVCDFSKEIRPGKKLGTIKVENIFGNILGNIFDLKKNKIYIIICVFIFIFISCSISCSSLMRF